MNKVCTRCFVDQPINLFNKNQVWCRVCQKSRYIETLEAGKKRKQEYYNKNKKEILAKSSEYQKANRHLNRKAGALWRANHPDKVKQKRLDEQYRTTYRRWWKRQLDNQYRLEQTLRSRTRAAFKGLLKDKTCKELLGCSYVEVLVCLESKFQPGMTWDNYGKGWHIDHITPLSSAGSKEELEKLCHHTNLQPLWAADNLSKGSKIYA